MAIAYRAAATGYQNAGTSVTATLPASAQVDDTVLAFVTLSDATVGDPGISGGDAAGTWTQLGAGPVDDNTCRTKVWWRTVVSGDAGATITSSWTSSAKGGIVLLAYSGAHTTSPIDTHATTTETGTDTTHDAPGVTPSVADCWVVELVAQRSSACTTITAPAGRTERTEQLGFGAGTVCQIGADSAATVSSGVASGAKTYTFDQSTANAVGWSIALAPGSTSTPIAGTDSGTLTEGTTTLEAASTATDSGTLSEAKTLTADTTATDSGTLAESSELAVTGEPEFRVLIDWDGDGTFDDAGEDVTARVLAAGGLTTSFGRDQARAVAPPKTGEAAFQLNNLSGDYSPDNIGSPLAGDLLPAREILAEIELNGTAHTLFRGHIDDFDVKVEHGGHEGAVSRVDVTALDPLANLRGAKISTELYQGIRTGTAIGYILDAVGWPAELRDLDPGATLIRWWWAHNEDAWDALMKLVGSEGPGAIVHANESGGITFRDRHHRLLDTASTTTQAVLTDGTGGYEPAFSSMSYDHGWRDIINSVSMTVDELDPSDEPEEIWSTPTAYSLSAGGSVTIEIETSDPIKIASASPSYSYSGGPVTADWVRNSAQSISLTLTAGGSAAHITELRMLGQPVAKRRSYTVTHTDAASIAKYKVRSPTSSIEAPWAGLYDANAIAELIIGARAERSPVVTVEFRGVHKNVRLVEQIGRDLSDRIHVTETVTGLDADMFLEQIKHTVLPGGFVNTTFGLEKAAQQAEGVFRFDDPDHGFDDGVFAAAGLDDPDTLFRFDVAGHGFNDGVFAT